MKTASQGISLLWLLLLVACTTANAPDTPAEKKFAQMTYSTPEGAVSALGTAYARDEMKDISEILGDEGHRLISSGDPVIDRQEANWFRSLYKEGHEVELQGNAQAILNLGRVGQRYPIPLVKEAGLWRFDTIVGHEDLLSRRISKTELITLSTVVTYVAAQREYYSKDRNGDGIREYAQQFGSSLGKHDGLYCEKTTGERLGPLAELWETARQEGYRKKEGEPLVYRGYVYKILSHKEPSLLADRVTIWLTDG